MRMLLRYRTRNRDRRPARSMRGRTPAPIRQRPRSRIPGLTPRRSRPPSRPRARPQAAPPTRSAPSDLHLPWRRRSIHTYPPNITRALSAAQPVLRRAWEETQSEVTRHLAEIHAQYERQVRHVVGECERLAGLVEEARREKEAMEQVRKENVILKMGIEVLREALALRAGEELRLENARLEGRVRELEAGMGRMREEWCVSESVRRRLYAENKRLREELAMKEARETGTLQYPSATPPPRSPSGEAAQEPLVQSSTQRAQDAGAGAGVAAHIFSADTSGPPPTTAPEAQATADSTPFQELGTRLSTGTGPRRSEHDAQPGPQLQLLDVQGTQEPDRGGARAGALEYPEYPESADPYLPLLRRFGQDRAGASSLRGSGAGEQLRTNLTLMQDGVQRGSWT
ncbi:hypothetical protein LshimejAT787_0100640 [Lyophyllum shimeji]|uniref:Uncharacterized protein n=1 Tax=Lyophyllum shimeji TaxID=47721 RepID=A0A9P3PCZ2_LYOSH|nr:hypothetical protein LshimejAT787_0100640 [Lyophyllum shimeji]